MDWQILGVFAQAQISVQIQSTNVNANYCQRKQIAQNRLKTIDTRIIIVPKYIEISQSSNSIILQINSN